MPIRERTLYLTFDDGPTPIGTPTLLNLLERYDARATFFLVGRHAARYPELVRELHHTGHTLGNHTFTHPDPWSTPIEDLTQELNDTSRLLSDLTGESIRYMRPPYGHLTPFQRRWCRSKDHELIMWDVLGGDFYHSTTTQRVEKRVLRMVRPGSIVVLHDNPRFQHLTLPALSRVLPVLKDQGWQFDSL